MDYQWYPGHMTKARRMMEENIRLVDLVIELVDARIPLSSRNPDIDALCRGKSRIVLLCKADLADPVKTEQFVEYFQKKGFLAAAVDARQKRAGEIIRRQIQEACREKLERDRARGIVGRPVRAMVAGIPNVGKSTFINSFAGRVSAKTGNKPGVTRGKQWIHVGNGVEVLDTPGILWPKFDDQRIGMRLALVGAIRDEILDKEELAVKLLEFLEREYPGSVREKYLGPAGASDANDDPSGFSADQGDSKERDLIQVDSGTALTDRDGSEERSFIREDTGGLSLLRDGPGETDGYALLLQIAEARRLLQKGGVPDAARAAAMLIDDCKNGRIGRISLDSPQEAGRMEELRRTASKRAEGSRRTASDRFVSKKAESSGQRGAGSTASKGAEGSRQTASGRGPAEGKTGQRQRNAGKQGRTRR